METHVRVPISNVGKLGFGGHASHLNPTGCIGDNLVYNTTAGIHLWGHCFPCMNVPRHISSCFRQGLSYVDLDWRVSF